MTSVTATVDIAASSDQVWTVLNDPARFSTWMQNHEGFVGEPPEALAPGGSFTQRVRVLGMAADIRWQIEGLEEPRRLELSAKGPMGIGLGSRFLVEPTGPGCRATWTMSFSGAAVMAVGAQLEREVGASQQASLGALRSLVEAG